VVKRTSGVCPICRARVQSLQRVYTVAGQDESAKKNDASDSGEASKPEPPMHVNDDVAAADLDEAVDLEEKLDRQLLEDNEWPDDVSSGESEDAASDDPSLAPFLSIAPARDIPDSGTNAPAVPVAVSITVPETFPLEKNEVIGTDVACVVDVSGSMGTLAVESDGVPNKDGLSILDIVKHALKTVMHSLGPQDRLALVGFSTTANTVFTLQPMTEENRKKALEALEGTKS